MRTDSLTIRPKTKAEAFAIMRMARVLMLLKVIKPVIFDHSEVAKSFLSR